MTTASIGGSGRPSVRTVRSSRVKASGRHRKKHPGEDKKEPKKPDIEELRQKRAAYFGPPVAERRKFIRPKKESVTATSVKSRTVARGEVRHKKIQTSSLKSSSNKTSRGTKKSEPETVDYVYASTAAPEPKPSSVRRSQVLDTGGASTTETRQHSRHGSVSRRRSLPKLAESELTPDDSISVVAERRISEHSRARPSLNRSSTTSSKLPPVAEKYEEAAGVENPRALKRESTLLGALFRRNTTAMSAPTPPRLVECLTCGSDDVPHANSAKLTCGHRMCHDCLKRVFEMSVNDPAHMPPRCCTEEHIPLKHVDKIFDVKFKTQWNRKYQEYKTKNRIYCPAPECSYWIKPSHIHRDSQGRKYAHCPRCKTKVCTLCNNKMHKSRDCPKDPEIAKLVEQAKEKGWQRCFECNAFVELKEGCNHMTCRCMAEFCMICGSKWKTCDCPWFNYTNLPNPDRLNDMRVPEPIRVIYRRVFDANATAAPPPPPPLVSDREPRIRHASPRDRTYQQELDERRRQERLDADLARRLQLASLMETEEPLPARRRAQDETFGLGNAAGHFMNDNFVQNAADVVMSAFGDANMGRRGERASGRRRRARQTEQNAGDTGLAPNFLGDASVLGI